MGILLSFIGKSEQFYVRRPQIRSGRSPACDSCESCDSFGRQVVSRSTPTIGDIVTRLTSVKLLVLAADSATPDLAQAMRREACESMDAIIRDLSPYVRGVPR